MTNNESNRDLELKLMCKMLFKQMGYYTHYEIKLRTKSYISTIKTHDISDIDVFGYLFLPDMTYHSLGAECKSGETNALDELYKFIGVMDYQGIDKGYFIKTKIHNNARQVSTKKKVTCFTEAELRKILLGFGCDIDRQLRIEKAIYNKLNQSINSEENVYQRLVNYIRYEYWNKDNWRNIHNLIHFLSKKDQDKLFTNISVNTKTFLYYVAELFSISTLKNLSNAILESYSDIETSITNQLYGGGEMLTEKRRILDIVNQASSSDMSFSPPWEQDFIKMSSRMANQMNDSSKIPVFIQAVREESFYSSKMQIKPKLVKQYSDTTRKYVQDVLQFLTKNASIEEDIFREVMEL